jgi:hypothetical protein
LDTTTDLVLEEGDVVLGAAGLVLKVGVAFSTIFLVSIFSEVFDSRHHPEEKKKTRGIRTANLLAQQALFPNLANPLIWFTIHEMLDESQEEFQLFSLCFYDPAI